MIFLLCIHFSEEPKKNMNVIAGAINKYRPSFVFIDPVMVSTTGHRLLEIDQIEKLKEVLLPLAVVTPNLQEAEVLLGREIATTCEMQLGCKELISTVRYECFVKGSYFPIRA